MRELAHSHTDAIGCLTLTYDKMKTRENDGLGRGSAGRRIVKGRFRTFCSEIIIQLCGRNTCERTLTSSAQHAPV